MDKYITIKEASILTGKAEITIRQLIKRLANQNGGKGKKMVVRKKTPSGYTYNVDKELLLTELKMAHLLSNQRTNQKSKRGDQVSNQMINHRKRKVGNDCYNKSAKGDMKSDDTIKMLKETIGILRE